MSRIVNKDSNLSSLLQYGEKSNLVLVVVSIASALGLAPSSSLCLYTYIALRFSGWLE